MSRDILENAAINVGYCGREVDRAKAALETAQSNLDRAKDELFERALAFRSSQPMPVMNPQVPAPPPMAPAMPAPSWESP